MNTAKHELEYTATREPNGTMTVLLKHDLNLIEVKEVGMV